jgi:hypothetical protein
MRGGNHQIGSLMLLTSALLCYAFNRGQWSALETKLETHFSSVSLVKLNKHFLWAESRSVLEF